MKLSTFLSWGKENVIGFKTDEKSGTTVVNYAWCKVCAKNYDSIIKIPFFKGEIKTAVKTFVDGTNNLTKYKIERHLKSKSHEIARSVEQDRPINERIIIEQPDETRKIQPTITSCINASAKDSYRKLVRTNCI